MEQAAEEAITQLLEEEEEVEVEPLHQLRKLSKLAVDLKKQVQEMKTNQQLSTPPEML